MIKAVADKIIVREMKREKTSGGIVLPSTGVDPQGYGKVVSVGEAVDTSRIKEGAIVIFHVNGGMVIVIENEIYKCLAYGEIYGVLSDPKAKEKFGLDYTYLSTSLEGDGNQEREQQRIIT